MFRDWWDCLVREVFEFDPQYPSKPLDELLHGCGPSPGKGRRQEDPLRRVDQMAKSMNFRFIE